MSSARRLLACSVLVTAAALTFASLQPGCVGDDPALSATAVPDAGNGRDDAAAPAQDAGPCEDTAFCDDRCGSKLMDRCGVVRDCSTPCGDGRKCDGLKCVCEVPSSWCAGRCETVTTNCGTPLPCGACDGGACTMGTCGGCAPETATVTCAGKACGFAKNNCGQTVTCADSCGGKACNNNSCCEAQSATCAGGKCGVVKNNCGQEVDCGNSCSGGMHCAPSSQCVCYTNSKPLGAPQNCGGCDRDCSGLNCVSGTCSCAGHNTNTDLSNCGTCLDGPVNCVARGFLTCSGGQCQ